MCQAVRPSFEVSMPPFIAKERRSLCRCRADLGPGGRTWEDVYVIHANTSTLQFGGRMGCTIQINLFGLRH
jgi:hypothetical protein